MSENTTYQKPMLPVVVSPANLTASQESETQAQMKGICGLSITALFAKLCPGGLWAKMSQGYYQARMDGTLVEFSQTWPRAGMMSNGKCYRLPPLVRRTSVKGLSLLPTPTASDYKKVSSNKQFWLQRQKSRGGTDTLPEAVVMYLNGGDGRLHPHLLEWLMGFPPGWTEVE